jgi:hypothetical protein
VSTGLDWLVSVLTWRVAALAVAGLAAPCGDVVLISYPQVGMLGVRREKLPIGDSGGRPVVICQAEPGSARGGSLGFCGSLAWTAEAAAGAGGAPEPRTWARGSSAAWSAGRDTTRSGAIEHILIANQPFRLMSAC